MRALSDVAQSLGLSPEDYDLWGPERAKIRPDVLMRRRSREGQGRLVLVSAMTPTPAGEGKTTTSIGLAQGLSQLGDSVVTCLREPSLGPIFGVKGGGTGGGKSQLHPAVDINLHFTGDLHAVSAANNLLAAMIDNHLHFRLEPRLHPGRIQWRRVVDMNDRALRQIVVGLGGAKNGTTGERHFDITAASEVMAILCLADSVDDLRTRLGRILVGFDEGGKPVTADTLGATGGMLALLKDAMRPNLVQTSEGVPAIVHGGPFANIAHGCSSVLGTRLGLQLADWVITEAGFGFDLGAEKFFDIKCRSAGLDTAAVVLVATARALKHHGGAEADAYGVPNPDRVAAGLGNLEKHLESVRHFGETPIVALNRRLEDTEEEIAVVRERCAELGVAFAVADPYGTGGPGCTDLARLVKQHAKTTDDPYRPVYTLEQPVEEKIAAIAKSIYGASGVAWTGAARTAANRARRLGYGDLPVCVAKTQSSLSDNPKLRNRPTDFEVTVRDLRINAGAGFLVALLGDVVRMPGLPKRPTAWDIDVVDGTIHGVG
ncbi:MAG: formate--tetrahydrofolate ligase [Myxococcota bacterium]